LPRESRRRDEGVKIDVLYARDDIYGEREREREREESIVSPYPRRCSRRRDVSTESDPEVLSRVP